MDEMDANNCTSDQNTDSENHPAPDKKYVLDRVGHVCHVTILLFDFHQSDWNCLFWSTFQSFTEVSRSCCRGSKIIRQCQVPQICKLPMTLPNQPVRTIDYQLTGLPKVQSSQSKIPMTFDCVGWNTRLSIL